jgi:hypothetical protein
MKRTTRARESKAIENRHRRCPAAENRENQNQPADLLGQIVETVRLNERPQRKQTKEDAPEEHHRGGRILDLLNLDPRAHHPGPRLVCVHKCACDERHERHEEHPDCGRQGSPDRARLPGEAEKEYDACDREGGMPLAMVTILPAFAARSQGDSRGGGRPEASGHVIAAATADAEINATTGHIPVRIFVAEQALRERS